MSARVDGYPSVLADRKTEDDPSDVFDLYMDHYYDFAFANLSATSSYNSTSRELTVDVTTHPAVDLNGTYRLALVLTEDGVHGTTSGYAQVNYYSIAWSVANGYTPPGDLHGAGHQW